MARRRAVADAAGYPFPAAECISRVREGGGFWSVVDEGQVPRGRGLARGSADAAWVGVVRLGPIRGVFGEPAFRAYMSVNAISVVGTWMQRTAVGWYAWELTGSPFWLGMVAFADLFPAVLVGPLGGVLADRADRRRIMVWTQSAMAVATFTMACLIWAGAVGILGLVALVGLTGAHRRHQSAGPSGAGAGTGAPRAPADGDRARTASSSTAHASSALRWPGS